MSNLKTIRTAAILAAVLMAWVGTASATTVTSPAGMTYTSTLSATSTYTVFHGAFISFSCTHSQFAGKVESHGASSTVKSNLSSWTFSGCNYDVTVKLRGSLEIHATAGGNGTLTSSGTELLVHTSVGECIFTTSGTHIGTVTGGTPANVDLGSSAIPRTGGSFFCGSSMEWTGNYTFTTPSTLLLD